MKSSVGAARALTLAVDAIWYLSLAAVAVGVVLLVIIATHAVGGGALSLDVYFQLPSRAYRLLARPLSSMPAHVGVSSGQVAFASPRMSFVLLSGALLALIAAAWLFILLQLRRLLAALRAGEPFARQNELRLRRIGIAVIVFELAHALAVWASGLYLRHSLVAQGITLRSHFSLDIPVIVLGLLLLVIAAAFRVGSQLAEDQALTV